MKEHLLTLASLFFAAACLVSCGDDSKEPVDPTNPDKPSGKTPVVSIAADASFADDNTANLTLTLSFASDKEVKVKLAKAEVQSGKESIFADFDKTVKIPAGETTASIKVEADVLGLTDGEYQTAIKIDSADGATVADNSVVYINFNYVFKPAVNLYADTEFSQYGTATLRIALEKATTADVVVKLAAGDGTSKELSFNFDKSVTIPAGETSAEVTITAAIPDNLANGAYKLVINATSAENGLIGTNGSATINLFYPFGATIFIDGDFDDWAAAPTSNFACPEGSVYNVLEEMRIAANTTDLYILLVINEPQPEMFDLFPMPVDIFVDADGNTATGGHLTSLDDNRQGDPFSADGLEWYIENGNIHAGQGYIDFTTGAYKYTGADGGSIWSLDNQTGKYGAAEMFAVGTLCEDNKGRVEIRMNRKYFGITKSQAAIGVKLMNGNNSWACVGVLPQAKACGEEYTPGELGEMVAVNIPEYAE